MANRYHLAQANIARMRAPEDDPLMAGFVGRLEALNALADSSPGFVWRLQTEDGDATAIRAFADERILFNLSTWESVEALMNYVYHSAHTEALRRRAEWFERQRGTSLVLWWIPAGHRPTVAEAKERLEILDEHGPGPTAFTFRQPFPPPDEASATRGDTL